MYPVPNDGIQRRDSTNWYCAPAGSKRTAIVAVNTSTATATASATHLAAVRRVAGTSMTAPAPRIGAAHNTLSHGKALTTPAPP
jgi:hypothetical protein